MPTSDDAATPPPTGKMRVLVVTDEMEVGGTQRQIVHLARGLGRSGHEVTVVYFRNPSFLVDELERAGITVREIPKRRRLDPGFVLALRAFVREGGFDVLHCFSFTGELWGAVAWRLMPRRRRPVLITSVRNRYDWYSPLQWRLKRWASLKSSTVIANSRAGGEYARAKMGLVAGAIEVIYNGVADAPPEALAATPASVRGKPVTALFVGRMVEQKNVPVLLRAMRRLREAAVPLRLRLAGDGPLRSAIAEQLGSLDLAGDVELLGERSDIAMLIAEADFVVQSSLREGLSNVILEAMVVGRPVVASAVGGTAELVEPMVTGLLFPSDDDAALAAAMQQLALEPELRRRLGAAGRARALERFTIAAMVQATQESYRRCRDRRGAQHG